VTQAAIAPLTVIAFLIALRIVQDTLVYPRLIRHGMHLSTPALVLSLWTGAALAAPAAWCSRCRSRVPLSEPSALAGVPRHRAAGTYGRAPGW